MGVNAMRIAPGFTWRDAFAIFQNAAGQTVLEQWTGGCANSTTLSRVSTSALQFDGMTNYVEIAAAPVFDVTTLTVEAWIRLDAPITVKQARIANRQITSPGVDSWNLEIFAPNHGANTNPIPALVFQSNDCQSHYQLLVPYNFQIGKWYHVAATNDGQTIRLYVNGVEIGNIPGVPQCRLPGVPIHIGAQGAFSQFYFPGTIDEVRFWDHARTGSELSQNMRTYLTGTEAGLLGLWRFDEGSGNTSADATGRGNHAMLRNSPSWVAQTW